MKKNFADISTNTKPNKRSLSEKLGITLVTGGTVKKSDMIKAMMMN